MSSTVAEVSRSVLPDIPPFARIFAIAREQFERTTKYITWHKGDSEKPYGFSRENVFLFGRFESRHQAIHWESGTERVCGYDLPKQIGTYRVAIGIELFFENDRLLPFADGHQQSLPSFEFLRQIPSLKTIYVYWWRPGIGQRLWVYPRVGPGAKAIVDGFKSNIPVVVDLYDDQRLSEILSFMSDKGSNASNTDMTHYLLCVNCERKRWEDSVKKAVIRLWMIIHADDLGSEARKAVVFESESYPVKEDDEWVKEKLAAMPEIRPCVIFECRLLPASARC